MTAPRFEIFISETEEYVQRLPMDCLEHHLVSMVRAIPPWYDVHVTWRQNDQKRIKKSMWRNGKCLFNTNGGKVVRFKKIERSRYPQVPLDSTATATHNDKNTIAMNDCTHENHTLIESGSTRGYGYAIYKCDDCGEEYSS